MKRLLSLALCLTALFSASGQLSKNKSSLPQEPGTFSIEGLTPKPVQVRIAFESPAYSTSKFDRAIGSFAPGTVVTLVSVSDTAYRVRGRARHGDIAGWLRQADVLSKDPQLAAKLKSIFERSQKVAELVEKSQIALGMTTEEVQASLGKPTRKNTKINAIGKTERFEYAIFEKVPQTTMGLNPFGQLVPTVVYVKVEVGTLTVSFKDGIVDEIEETKGNPLRGMPVPVVPAPIFF